MILSRQQFIQDYTAYMDYLVDVEPNDALQELRREGERLFSRLGLPGPSNEEWHYTDMRFLSEHQYKICTSTPHAELENMKEYCTDRLYYNHEDINIVFINGVFSEEFSDYLNKPLPGLSIQTIPEYLQSQKKSGADIFNDFPNKYQTPFLALNQAMIHTGSVLNISQGTRVEPVIHIIHVTAISQPMRQADCCGFNRPQEQKRKDFSNCTCGELITAPRTYIRLEPEAKAVIVESHISLSSDIHYFSNAVTDINLQPRASLHYYKSQNESLKAYHVGLTRVWQEHESLFSGFSFMTGSALTRNDLAVVSNGSHTSSTLDALYSVNGKQHVDNHTSIEHCYPESESHQFYKGILNGSSRAVFNGKIIVRAEAQKTVSHQLNKNLIAGKHCRVDAKPQLEIFADDVKCSHGATNGQLNPEEIFYLQTRSIPHREAVKMLSHGFAEEILGKIPYQSIRNKLNIFLTPSLLTI